MAQDVNGQLHLVLKAWDFSGLDSPGYDHARQRSGRLRDQLVRFV
jgi:hypothetical protein